MSEPKNSGRLPAFQFYPADWRKDPGVQSLDFETRGIWWEIICLLHESDERGVLLLNGQPMPEDALCRLLGLDNQKLTTALTTLLTYGVAKRRESDNAIYSKRMVADEKLRQIRREAGFKGGNPALLNQNPTTGVKQTPTPSSSSSSSFSSSPSGTTTKVVGRTAARSPQLPDEEWVKSLENDPTYQVLNIRQELGKMQRWCETNRKQPSRARFVNWINRAEKPIGVNGQQKPKHAAYDAATATAGKTTAQVTQF